tara:strand:+ start:288 stop:422 length:135 start_codon:yes stop_codon:yes gene_type:complete
MGFRQFLNPLKQQLKQLIERLVVGNIIVALDMELLMKDILDVEQ